MAAVTLTNLLARVRERADMVGSNFVADSANSVYYFINTAANELYDLLTSKFQDYYTTSASLTITGGTNFVALPATHYKTVGVEVLSNGQYRTLYPFQFAERNLANDATAGVLDQMRYQIRGSNIYFTPTPGVSGTGRIWYIPTRTQMTTGADSEDFGNGWEEYVIVRAAIGLLDKEESDTSALRADLAALKRRIDEAAANRDAGAPTTIADTEAMRDARVWPYLGEAP